MKRWILGGLGVLLIAAALFIVPTVWFKPWSIDHFYARVFIRYALRHPMLLTQLGILDRTPFAFHADKLDDYSIAFEDEDLRFAREQLAILRSYDRSHMTADQQLSADVLGWFLADQVAGQRFRFHDYPVNQLFGVQNGLPDFMINTHPLKRPRDAESYVRRLEAFGVVLDQVIEQLEARKAKGVVPPRFVLREVLTEMRGFTGKPVDQNPLALHFTEKVAAMPGLDEARRGELTAQVRDRIGQVVYPAYGRLIACCEGLEKVATDDDGVWKLPDGDAYYDYRLHSVTTTSLSADTIHAIGLREVARIQTEMRSILTAKGYPTADLGATMNRLRNEPRFHFPAGDSGRAAIMAEYQSIIDDANRRVGALFDVRPSTSVRVERVPAFREATAPGAYYQAGAIDGSRPGAFYANLRDPAETARPMMRTLAYHEAIPGHHFQIGIAQGLKGVPFFRRIVPFTAYSEGWGLYAEHLALEQGFQPTAFDSLGALQADLFRAVRLVVDTGIHRDHWTRAQAIDYMERNTGMAESAVTTEVERYIVNPGQACAYKVGELEILALRQHAMDRLGPRFDLRKFHDAVLTHGALPLGLLERVVDEWVASELRAGAVRAKG